MTLARLSKPCLIFLAAFSGEIIKGLLPLNCALKGVSTKPGVTRVTETELGFNKTLIASAYAFKPALLAQYAGVIDIP